MELVTLTVFLFVINLHNVLCFQYRFKEIKFTLLYAIFHNSFMFQYFSFCHPDDPCALKYLRKYSASAENSTNITVIFIIRLLLADLSTETNS